MGEIPEVSKESSDRVRSIGRKADDLLRRFGYLSEKGVLSGPMLADKDTRLKPWIDDKGKPDIGSFRSVDQGDLRERMARRPTLADVIQYDYRQIVDTASVIKRKRPAEMTLDESRKLRKDVNARKIFHVFDEALVHNFLTVMKRYAEFHDKHGALSYAGKDQELEAWEKRALDIMNAMEKQLDVFTLAVQIDQLSKMDNPPDGLPVTLRQLKVQLQDAMMKHFPQGIVFERELPNGTREKCECKPDGIKDEYLPWLADELMTKTRNLLSQTTPYAPDTPKVDDRLRQLSMSVAIHPALITSILANRKEPREVRLAHAMYGKLLVRNTDELVVSLLPDPKDRTMTAVSPEGIEKGIEAMNALDQEWKSYAMQESVGLQTEMTALLYLAGELAEYTDVNIPDEAGIRALYADVEKSKQGPAGKESLLVRTPRKNLEYLLHYMKLLKDQFSEQITRAEALDAYAQTLENSSIIQFFSDPVKFVVQRNLQLKIDRGDVADFVWLLPKRVPWFRPFTPQGLSQADKMSALNSKADSLKGNIGNVRTKISEKKVLLKDAAEKAEKAIEVLQAKLQDPKRADEILTGEQLQQELKKMREMSLAVLDVTLKASDVNEDLTNLFEYNVVGANQYAARGSVPLWQILLGAELSTGGWIGRGMGELLGKGIQYGGRLAYTGPMSGRILSRLRWIGKGPGMGYQFINPYYWGIQGVRNIPNIPQGLRWIGTKIWGTPAERFGPIQQEISQLESLKASGPLQAPQADRLAKLYEQRSALQSKIMGSLHDIESTLPGPEALRARADAVRQLLGREAALTSAERTFIQEMHLAGEAEFDRACHTILGRDPKTTRLAAEELNMYRSASPERLQNMKGLSSTQQGDLVAAKEARIRVKARLFEKAVSEGTWSPGKLGMEAERELLIRSGVTGRGIPTETLSEGIEGLSKAKSGEALSGAGRGASEFSQLAKGSEALLDVGKSGRMMKTLANIRSCPGTTAIAGLEFALAGVHLYDGMQQRDNRDALKEDVKSKFLATGKFKVLSDAELVGKYEKYRGKTVVAYTQNPDVVVVLEDLGGAYTQKSNSAYINAGVSTINGLIFAGAALSGTGIGAPIGLAIVAVGVTVQCVTATSDRDAVMQALNDMPPFVLAMTSAQAITGESASGILSMSTTDYLFRDEARMDGSAMDYVKAMVPAIQIVKILSGAEGKGDRSAKDKALFSLFVQNAATRFPDDAFAIIPHPLLVPEKTNDFYQNEFRTTILPFLKLALFFKVQSNSVPFDTFMDDGKFDTYFNSLSESDITHACTSAFLFCRNARLEDEYVRALSLWRTVNAPEKTSYRSTLSPEQEQYRIILGGRRLLREHPERRAEMEKALQTGIIPDSLMKDLEDEGMLEAKVLLDGSRDVHMLGTTLGNLADQRVSPQGRVQPNDVNAHKLFVTKQRLIMSRKMEKEAAVTASASREELRRTEAEKKQYENSKAEKGYQLQDGLERLRGIADFAQNSFRRNQTENPMNPLGQTIEETKHEFNQNVLKVIGGATSDSEIAIRYSLPVEGSVPGVPNQLDVDKIVDAGDMDPHESVEQWRLRRGREILGLVLPQRTSDGDVYALTSPDGSSRCAFRFNLGKWEMKADGDLAFGDIHSRTASRMSEASSMKPIDQFMRQMQWSSLAESLKQLNATDGRSVTQKNYEARSREMKLSKLAFNRASASTRLLVFGKEKPLLDFGANATELFTIIDGREVSHIATECIAPGKELRDGTGAILGRLLYEPASNVKGRMGWWTLDTTDAQKAEKFYIGERARIPEGVYEKAGTYLDGKMFAEQKIDLGADGAFFLSAPFFVSYDSSHITGKLPEPSKFLSESSDPKALPWWTAGIQKSRVRITLETGKTMDGFVERYPIERKDNKTVVNAFRFVRLEDGKPVRGGAEEIHVAYKVMQTKKGPMPGILFTPVDGTKVQSYVFENPVLYQKIVAAVPEKKSGARDFIVEKYGEDRSFGIRGDSFEMQITRTDGKMVKGTVKEGAIPAELSNLMNISLRDDPKNPGKKIWAVSIYDLQAVRECTLVGQEATLRIMYKD
jgi:hypothetical protein